jgi:acetyl esterase/lipase
MPIPTKVNDGNSGASVFKSLQAELQKCYNLLVFRGASMFPFPIIRFFAMFSIGFGNFRPLPVSLLAISIMVSAAHADNEIRTIQAISYGPSAEEVADLCLPPATSPVAPAIIFIHAGTWIKGVQSGFDGVCQEVAQQGIVGMTIQYRLAPQNNWPAQLEDVQLAVRWLRAHAKDYNVDPRRICSWGRSAGAHLAVFLGVLQATRPGDRADLYANESPAVSCVVDNFGPVDLTNAGRLQRGADRLVGNSSDAALHDASPIFLVNSHTAPMLIIQGDDDEAVDRTEQSEKLYEALKQRGIPTQLIIYHGGHGFKGASRDEINQYENAAIRFVLSTLNDQTHK